MVFPKNTDSDRMLLLELRDLKKDHPEKGIKHDGKDRNGEQSPTISQLINHLTAVD